MRRQVIRLLPFLVLIFVPALRVCGAGAEEMGSRRYALLLQRPPACQPPSPEEKERARLRIGITPQQQAEIENLFKQTGQERRAINARMHDLYHQLHLLYDAYDLDRRKARAVRDEIMTLNRRILTLHADTEEKLRRILNREQF